MNLGKHDKRCLAASLMATIENMRDDPETELVWFREAMVNGQLLEIADGYLDDGLMNCRCEKSSRADWKVTTEERTVSVVAGTTVTHFYVGSIRDGNNQLRWECDHFHMFKATALQCAESAFAFSWNEYPEGPEPDTDDETEV